MYSVPHDSNESSLTLRFDSFEHFEVLTHDFETHIWLDSPDLTCLLSFVIYTSFD
jgi:hypothetical protein